MPTITIKSRYNDAVLYSCEALSLREAVAAAVKDRAGLGGANLCGANLRGANLRGANLCGADLRGKKISALCVFSGLYEYQIWAYVLEDGSPWVRMGCQNRSVAEWDVLTIRESRTSEYPNDGSSRSERRARAFEFARGEALSMAHEVANQKDEK
jgi:hypothetical protein